MALDAKTNVTSTTTRTTTTPWTTTAWPSTCYLVIDLTVFKLVLVPFRWTLVWVLDPTTTTTTTTTITTTTTTTSSTATTSSIATTTPSMSTISKMITINMAIKLSYKYKWNDRLKDRSSQVYRAFVALYYVSLEPYGRAISAKYGDEHTVQ